MKVSESSVPFFSVITPVFNGEDHVAGYVRTLLGQTFGDWEAIVVDDGSTDGTAGLLAEAAALDPRFRIFRNQLDKKVAGPYLARNIGIELARGEFLCFLDIDDRWHLGKLAFHSQVLCKDRVLSLLFSAYFRAPWGDVSRAYLRVPPPPIFVKTWIRFANPIPMLTACVRRSLLATVRFKPVHHEDYLFWSEVIHGLRARDMHRSCQPLAIYTVDPTSLSGNKVKAAMWIWSCYRMLGYSRLNSAFAWAIRGLLQFFFLASDSVRTHLVRAQLLNGKLDLVLDVDPSITYPGS